MSMVSLFGTSMTYVLDCNNENPRSPDIDWRWRIVRRLAFSFDAEHMHELAIYLLKLKSLFSFKDLASDCIARHKIFYRYHMGLGFRNPIGLAAGFDVDADCLPALQLLGFGFIEVGGVTEHPQPGNAKPRIFRLPEDRAIINRLNFYNRGVLRLRKKLTALRENNRLFVPIGINLGKSNFSKLEDVPKEYLTTFKQICDVADYVTINVSCPNTAGLGRYQRAEGLENLLDAVGNFNDSLKKRVPLLLKVGPDLSNDEAIVCAETAVKYKLAGLIISNTTTKRSGLSTPIDYGNGGLSGQPLFEPSTQLLRFIAKDFGDRLTLVGSGGIMDGASAHAKLNAGADLLQVYTGFIYGGPSFVKNLLCYLKQNL